MNPTAKILVVEDEPPILKATCRLLEDAGYQTLGVRTGTEALEMARQHRPDLILLDVNLPDMLGLEVCQQIRADPALKATYIIILSGTRTDSESQALGLEMGADGYIARPVTNRELLARVQAMLRIRQAEMALRAEKAWSETLINSAQSIIVGLGEHSRILFFNKFAEQLTGYAAEEVLGKEWIETFIPPEQREELYAVWEGVVRNRCIDHHYENLILTRSGERRLIRWSNTVLTEDGQFRMVLSIGEDITEHRRREEEIQRLWQQSEEARRALLSILEDQRRVEEALRRRTRILELLNQAAQAFSSTLDLDRVLTSVLDAACRLMDVTAASIWMLEPETGELVCHQATGPGRDKVLGWRLAPGVGIAGWVAQHGKSLIVADALTDERHFPGVDEETGIPMRSIISIPLRTREAVIGVLQIVDPAADRFSPADLQLLEPLATSAAIAIENARLFHQAQQEIAERKRAEETIRQYAAQLEAVRQSGLELTAQLDLDTLLHSIVRRAVELAGGNAGGLYLYHPDQDALKWVVSMGPHQPPVGTLLRPGEGGISRRVWETGDPFWVDDYQHWEGRAPKYADYPWTAVMGVPVRWGKESLGVLMVLADPPRTFSQEDANLLTLFATHAAIAIANARLFTSLREERARLDFLHHLSQRLIATLDAFTVAQEALNTLCSATRARKGVIYLYEPDIPRLRLIAVSGYGEETVEAIDRRLQLQVGQGLAGWVALHRQTAVVDDVTQDERWLPVPEMNGEARAAISTPILVGGELVGVITIHSEKPAAFTSEDAQLIKSAAAIIGTALLNARLYEMEQERARCLAVVAQVSEQLSRLQDPETVYRETVEQIARAFGYDYVGLMLLDEEKGDLVFVAGAGIWAGRTPLGFRQRIEEGMIGWVAQHGETLLANDVSQEPRYIAPYLTETRAELDVPLKYYGKLIGVLTVQSQYLNAFTSLDVLAMESIAGHVAAAIVNTRFYEAEQRQRERAEALAQAVAATTSTLELQPLLENILTAAIQAIPAAEKGSILLVDEETGELEIRALWGYTDPRIARIRFPRESGYSALALREGRPLIIPEARAEPYRYDGEIDEMRAIRSAIVAPLRFREKAIGVISLDATRPAAFAGDDLALLAAFADHAAVAVENARLYEAERAARQRQEALYRIGQIVNSALDTATILDLLTDEAMRVTGATRGSVLVPDLEKGWFERRSLRGYAPEEAALATDHPLLLGRGINSRAFQERQIVYVPDVRENPDYYPLISETRSELVVPIRKEEEVLGNLDLQSPQVDGFRNVDLEFLRALADQVAIALENARLYEEERQRAQQQEILARITRSLNTLKVGEAFPVLVEGLRALTGCERVSVALLEGDKESEIIILDTPVPVLEAGTVVPLSTTPVWPSLFAGQPYECPDMAREVEFPAIRALYEAGFRSYLSLPLAVGGDLIGALHLVSTRPDNFRRAPLALLQQIADTLAVAIENERLYRAEQEQRALAEALAEAAAVVTSTLDLGAAMDRILEQARRVVPGDAFNIMLIEDGIARIVRSQGYAPFGAEERIGSIALPVAGTPNMMEMVSTGEPVLISDTATDPRWIRLEGLEWLRSYVGAPIVIKGITVGFLNVDGTRPGQFGPADAARLKTFAAHVATALENAQLYQELRDYANTLEERVRERTALLASQYAQLEAILRSTGDGIILTDAQGEIIQANPVAHQWLRTLPPENAQRLYETVQQVARRAHGRAEEILELPGLDLQVRATPIESGSEEAAVVVLHDITQFKTLERLRARFISNISHELRTPITTIKTYVHLLRQTPELLPQCLDVLEREVDWQVQLVEDVLEVSRLDSGKREMHFRPIALNELAERVMIAHWPLARASDILLEHRLSEPGPVAFADADALMMALNNLVRNAIQYTPRGGRVEVSTGKEERDGTQWATITVADTGIGIPKQEIPYIFDRFFRGDRPRQMQIPGTGLGLAIVKEIVEHHGGLITVESEEGKGSRFTVWLPCAEIGDSSF